MDNGADEFQLDTDSLLILQCPLPSITGRNAVDFLFTLLISLSLVTGKFCVRTALH